jgi:hypothetical protein
LLNLPPQTLEGQSRVEIDRAYLKQSGGYDTPLDNLIIDTIHTDAPNTTPAFFDNLLKCLVCRPGPTTFFIPQLTAGSKSKRSQQIQQRSVSRVG